MFVGDIDSSEGWALSQPSNMAFWQAQGMIKLLECCDFRQLRMGRKSAKINKARV